MSRVMMIIGILLVAIGIALALMVFFSTTSIVAWGLTPEVAAIIIVGGIVSIGFGGVIDTLEGGSGAMWRQPKHVVEAAPAEEELSPEVRKTIQALDDARQDIEVALGSETEPDETEAEPAEAERQGDSEEATAPPEPAAESSEEPQAEEKPAEAEEEQLYVVEERFIRNRPARILSDGTVEAETDEGWMRFENLEHLDEYLDAMAPQTRA